MNSFICDLDVLENAEINNLEGIVSNNISPSDLWISKIKYTKYNLELDSFYKVFVSPLSLPLTL